MTTTVTISETQQVISATISDSGSETVITNSINDTPQNITVDLQYVGPQGDTGDYFGVSRSSSTFVRDPEPDGPVIQIIYDNGITITLHRTNGLVMSVSSSDGKLKTINRDSFGNVTGVTLL